MSREVRYVIRELKNQSKILSDEFFHQMNFFIISSKQINEATLKNDFDKSRILFNAR